VIHVADGSSLDSFEKSGDAVRLGRLPDRSRPGLLLHAVPFLSVGERTVRQLRQGDDRRRLAQLSRAAGRFPRHLEPPGGAVLAWVMRCGAGRLLGSGAGLDDGDTYPLADVARHCTSRPIRSPLLGWCAVCGRVRVRGLRPAGPPRPRAWVHTWVCANGCPNRAVGVVGDPAGAWDVRPCPQAPARQPQSTGQGRPEQLGGPA
jgi:hypothetical protein